MNIFERIAQHFGYTFNVNIAKSMCYTYIPDSYIIIGLLLMTVAIAGIVLLVKKRRKG